MNKSGSELPKDEQGSQEPADDAHSPGGVARSGSGADTALLAMVQKRQMRANREDEPAPDGDGKNTTTE